MNLQYSFREDSSLYPCYLHYVIYNLFIIPVQTSIPETNVCLKVGSPPSTRKNKDCFAWGFNWAVAFVLLTYILHFSSSSVPLCLLHLPLKPLAALGHVHLFHLLLVIFLRVLHLQLIFVVS